MDDVMSNAVNVVNRHTGAGCCSSCGDVFTESHVDTGLFVENRMASERQFRYESNEPGKARNGAV
jgi:hypothetical protein